MLRLRPLVIVFFFTLLVLSVAPRVAAQARPGEVPSAQAATDEDVAQRASASAVDRSAEDRIVRFYGPLRIRDLQPLTLVFMDFVPSHAAEAAPGTVYLELGWSHANTFIKSKNVRDYLIDRGGPRRALSNEDFDNILALDGDAFYFDGAAGYATFTVHFAMPNDWGAYIQVPYLDYSGGFLDSTIESFHDRFGFSQVQRDLVARDQTQVLLKLGDDVFEVRQGPGNEGFGDPVLGVRKAFRRASGAAIVLEGAVKVPMAEEERFLSSGSTDFGLQVSFHKQWTRWGLYAAFSYVRLGDVTETLPEFAIDDVQKATGALERLIGRRWSMVLQGSYSPSPFQNTDTRLSEAEIQASIGLRYAFQRTGAFELAFTENLSNFNSTPDIGFHFGFGMPLFRIGG